MKKLFITTLLSTIALAAIVTLPNTGSSIDKLLMENIAALADIPPVSWMDGDPITLKDCWMTVTEDPGSAVGLRKWKLKPPQQLFTNVQVRG